MRRFIVVSVFMLATLWLAASLFSGASVARADEGELDGKEVFLAQKCNMCHSVPAVDIEKKTQSEKMAGPDLPAAEERDDEWMVKYLKKEVELDGQLHKKGFTGSDEELQAIIDWLGDLE